MATPRHIQIAKTDGVEHGFDAYMTFLKRSGLPLVQAEYKSLMRKKPENRLKWYCDKFAGKLGDVTVNGAQVEADESSSGNPLLDALAALIGGSTEGKRTLEALKAQTTPARGPGRPKGSKNKPKAVESADNAITAIEAWAELGGDENFKPRDPNKPATSGQLWQLNNQGRLSIV